MAVHGSSHPRSSRVLSRLGTAVAPATRDPACRSPEVLRDVVRRRGRSAVTGRTRRAPASCATPGAGHPASPFEVLASLGPGQRGSLGLPGPLPEAPASGLTAAPTDGGWTGPVGVLGTGHTAGGIVETVAPSGRPVRVLARSEASGARLLGALGKRLIRAVSRGRLDEGTRAEVFGRVSLTHHAAALAGSDVVIEAVAEDLAVEAAVLGAVDAALRRRCRWRSAPRPSVSVTCAPSVPSGRPVLALHLVDPAQVMRLVEVAVPDDVPDAAGLQTTRVPGPATSTRPACPPGRSPTTSVTTDRASPRDVYTGRRLAPEWSGELSTHVEPRRPIRVGWLSRWLRRDMPGRLRRGCRIPVTQIVAGDTART